MDNLPNIYFCGKAGAGKTYLCNYIMKNYKYTQSKFAYPVYQICRDYLNMTTKDRKLLQYLGTDVGRAHINKNIWVDRFLEDTYMVQVTSKELYDKEIKFCSDDVRFPNEHEALKEAGWVGIYLAVPDEIRIQRLGNRDGDAQVNTLQHASETALDSFKDELIQLDSSGSLEDTYRKLEETLEYIRREKSHGISKRNS